MNMTTREPVKRQITKRQIMNTEKIVLEIATAPPDKVERIAIATNAFIDGMLAGLAMAGQTPEGLEVGA